MHNPRHDNPPDRTWSSDEQLARSLAAREAEALSELVRRHEPWLRGVVYSVLGATDEVDDVLQHVWQTVWRRREELGEVANWRNWLYRTARRASIDAWRSRRRRRKLGRDLAQQRPSPTVGPDRAELREQYERTLRAVSGLPEKYRIVLTLRAWQGMSYERIAQTLGLRVATVETRLVRARRMLRDSLGRQELS